MTLDNLNNLLHVHVHFMSDQLRLAGMALEAFKMHVTFTIDSNCGDALLTNNICMKYDQVVIIVKQHGCDLFQSVYI